MAVTCFKNANTATTARQSGSVHHPLLFPGRQTAQREERRELEEKRRFATGKYYQSKSLEGLDWLRKNYMTFLERERERAVQVASVVGAFSFFKYILLHDLLKASTNRGLYLRNLAIALNIQQRDSCKK